MNDAIDISKDTPFTTPCERCELEYEYALLDEQMQRTGNNLTWAITADRPDARSQNIKQLGKLDELAKVVLPKMRATRCTCDEDGPPVPGPIGTQVGSQENRDQ